MKKYPHLFILLLLILTGLLAGCGSLGFEEETTTMPQEPINRETWPTPVPTAPQPSPTPFPKVTLAPTTIPTPFSTATTESDGAATSDSPAPAINAEGLISAVTEQVSSLGAGLSPVAVGFVTTDRTTIRQGPGSSYGAVTTVDSAELLGIFGQNPDGNWLYVVTITAAQGWVPIETLRITGSLADAPVLPPDPMEAAIAAAVSPASENRATADSTASPGASQSTTLDDLAPVTTATVKAVALNMRQRPGPTYKQLDTLSEGDQVTILALNRDEQWALIETAAQKYGWVSTDFLQIEGELSNAPQVRTLTPNQDDQAAPIVVLSGSVQSAAVANSGGDGGEPTAAVVTTPTAAVTTAGSSLPNNTLAPVATAKVTTKDDLRRGPGETYGAVAPINVDEELTVLAVDQAGSWAVVTGANSKVGWANLQSLTVEGPLDNAPPVETAWVDSNALDVKSGPGIYYETVGKLAMDTLVSILALDENRSWALVQTQAGGEGWSPLRFLTITGSLANVPEIAGPALAQGDPASQAVAQTEPVIDGKIVLQLASGGDIMAINADGTGLRRLTHGIDPALSPDGRQVAFTRWQGEEGSVWLTDLDGSNERQVLGFIKQAKGPAWSPDGSRIVINFQQGGSLEEKSVCQDVTEGGVRPPRNASRVRFRIDDNGDPVLCWRMPPNPMWNLRVIDLPNGDFADFDGGTYAFRPTWDPARSWRIVSDGGRGLVELDLNQEQEQPLTDNTGDSSPVFSPDGRYLAVTAGHPGGGQGYDIYRLNADGSGRVRLTQTPLWETALPEEKQAWNNVAPAWSPDGLQIAFLTDRTGRWEIWVMNLDGSNQRPLFPDEINDQLGIQYNFVDERVLSWR